MSNFSNWELNHEFVPQVGILLPNGNFESNEGQGHPKHAMTICQKLKIDIPSGINPDDFLIMSGAAMIATYDAFKKKQIKIAKNNPHYKEMSKIINTYVNHGFDVIEGWDMNLEYQKKLDEALELLLLFVFELLVVGLFAAPLVPFNIIFCIALYVSLESNSLETTFPFKLFII